MKNQLFVMIILISFSCKTTKLILPHELYEIIEKQIENEEWNKAEKNLTRLIKKIPEDAELIFQRGFVKEKNHKYLECIADFTKVIELNPYKHVTRTNRGYAYRKLGKYDKAIKDFESELIINPNPYSYEHLSMVYFLKKDNKKALESINVSIQKEPENAIAYKTRALIYKQMGQKEAACSDRRKAIELNFIEKFPKYKPDMDELEKFCKK